MEKRINIQKIEPKAYEAMFSLENYLSSTNLNKTLKNLIKIRASQINGCAYCIDLHTKEALASKEDKRRIFALSVWKESYLFTAKEKTVLKMTEEISYIAKKGLCSKTYALAQKLFSDLEIAQIIMEIVTINMWNRIAISTHLGNHK